MFTISLSTKDFLSQKVDCYGYIVEKDFKYDQLDELIKNFCPNVLSIVKKRNFTGSYLSTLSIPFVVGDTISYCIFVGLGDQSNKVGISDIESYRRAIGQLSKEVKLCGGKSVALKVAQADFFSVSLPYLVEQAVISFSMALYSFDDYITDKNAKEKELNVSIVVDVKDQEQAEAGFSAGTIIGNAVNQARHLVDMPPSSLTPQDLVKQAQAVASRNNLIIKVFHELEVNAMGMGGLSAVSRGSDIDCALIVLEYKAKKENAPTLCFVGKGITFDSGGLSLKPAEFMETMKEDMSGAAAVIASIDALAQLDCDVNVIAIAPTSENLPSGKAVKPGDIVTFYNGKTAEIKNTDAEGRLILADALSYAVKCYKPDVIVDLATLTGACSRALGPFYSGLFTEYNQVKDRLYAAAELSGDKLWQLPMGEDYKKAITSTVADISNIGSGKISAGATTAAHFLQNFVDDTPWAHIDIAGTAFDVPNISYYRSGATGVGVRLITAFAMNWITYNKSQSL